MNSELAALRAVDFNWTRALRDVWTDPLYHVDDLNKSTVDAIIDDFHAATHDANSNPVGQVIQGRAGSGKTHLIGMLRRRVWEAKGWFVLIDIIGVTDFWQTAALSFLESLHQAMPSGRLQYQAAIARVLTRLFGDANVRSAIGKLPAEPLTRRSAVELYLKMLKRLDPVEAPRHQDVVRALIYLDSEEGGESNFAYMWLQGQNVDDRLRRELGFVAWTPKPVEAVRGLLWLLSLAGPTMIAVDQIDAIVSASNRASEAVNVNGAHDAELSSARALIELLALGLIELHDVKRRAVTVVSCLEVTWPILAAQAIEPFKDRFRVLDTLAPINRPAIVAKLIEERLAKGRASVGFAAPYPTWPFRPEAIESAVGLRPRQILIRCQEHRRACLAMGEVKECLSLADKIPLPVAPPQVSSNLDALYQREFSRCDPSVFGKDEAADAARLTHVCELYLGCLDLPESVDGEVKPDANRRAPSLHASLAFVFHDEGDKQQRWCFRFLPQDNAIAFQSRLKAAITASGIDTALRSRRLIVLRDNPPPRGAKTQELTGEFLRAGGKFVALTEHDRRAFLALIALADKQLPEFEAWLRARRPLLETSLFQQAGLAPPDFLATPAAPPADPSGSSPPPSAPTKPAPVVRLLAKEPTAPATPVEAPASGGRTIIVGRKLEHGAAGAAVALEADLLSRHVAIVGGPGSGKTVLIRRLIEEAALIRIPALALDANNDLSRLGEPWPTRPESFSDDDAVKARAYHQRVEVIIWTPGASGGNPLSLRLLPDFSAIGVGGDVETEEEREQAVQMALATLAPSVTGGGQKAKLKQGVLAEAMRLFARRGGSAIDDLLALLGDFDDEASKITDARKLARELADQLNALIATNPLSKMSGPYLDPAELFEDAAGKTRVSVINLGGLASDALKQAFVNRLNMALFSWIKQHPSPTGRLYALDEAQTYAPSQIKTACSQSTNSLVAQARKYGLGMIFATQHPKGIANAIVSNATTHFYGRVSAPASIQAIQEMATAKGGGADDIARLSKGEFYFATEGLSRPIKIRAPLCLSWQAKNPPTAEEVAALARQRRPLTS